MKSYICNGEPLTRVTQEDIDSFLECFSHTSHAPEQKHDHPTQKVPDDALANEATKASIQDCKVDEIDDLYS